jgi:hypothetical protein
MGLWSRLQQWLYARPRVAATGAILVLVLAGAAGWESSRLAAPDATQVAGEPQGGVAGVQARMIQVEAAAGPVTRVVRRTRTITAAGPTMTVVQRRIRTRTVRDMHTIRKVVTVTAPNAGQPQAHVQAAVTRPIRIMTVTRVQTQTQTHIQTETQTVTQPPVTVTVFVTTNRGHGH